jgi:hypothetical protein
MTPAKVSNHTGAHQRRESPRAQFHLPKPRASLPTHSRSPTPRRTHAAQACKSSGAPPTQTTRQAHLGPATNSLNRACSRDGPQQRSLSRAQSSPENRHRQGPLPRSPYVTTTCCQEAPQSYKPYLCVSVRRCLPSPRLWTSPCVSDIGQDTPFVNMSDSTSGVCRSVWLQRRYRIGCEVPAPGGLR